MDTPVRSTFVTVVAWVFIALSVPATLISVIQNIMIQTMFSRGDVSESLQAAMDAGEISEIERFIFENTDMFFLAFFFMSLTALAASIGLLLRKNWARLVFVGLLVVGIFLNLGGFFFAVVFTESAQVPPGHQMAQELEDVQRSILIANAVFALAVTALFGWITYKLLTPAIREEFSQHTS